MSNIGMEDLIKLNNECIEKHKDEFKNTFGVDITNFFSGKNKVFGFDIIGFDKQIIQSGNDSPANVTREKYGQRAVDLINEILEYPGYV